MKNPFKKRAKKSAPEQPKKEPRKVGVSISLAAGGVVKALLNERGEHSCTPDRWEATIGPEGARVTGRSNNYMCASECFAVESAEDAEVLAAFYAEVAKVMRGSVTVSA